MRLLGCVTTWLVLLLAASSASALTPRCGSAAGDAATVAAMESEVAAQCDCCGPPATNAPCALNMVRAGMHVGGLSRTCARKVLRDTIHACPRASANLPCQLCNSDADCGAGEFCECRMASCDKTGGVCVARPDVCPQIAAPVCGCDGMTYANDCERQAAGACKRKNGACVEAGGCVDTGTGQCTGEACSPQAPCTHSNEMCSPTCTAPPPRGTCFDLVRRSCTGQACGENAPCLPKQACLPFCPSPMPVGKCFVTVDGQCTDEVCGPGQPCQEPNEFCSPACLGSPGGCATDADCDDGNGCTVDRCVKGTCEHECVCAAANGTVSCCPGPSALCVKPCGSDASGTCGGSCPTGSSCTTSTAANPCGCVSPLGGPCGGNILVPPPVCAPGLVCEQSNPDVTGVCVEPCGSGAMCGGPCTRPCADGTEATGSCAAGSDATLPCTCAAQCNPTPTPTVGPCGDSIDACGGDCPVICPDGTAATGRCAVVVVDPPGKIGAPIGPTCRCFADCPEPPTPTPGPCSSSPQCGGSCSTTCSDGTTATGKCIPAPVAVGVPEPIGGCACIADCGPPPPSPTPGPCGSSPNCSGTCPFTCADGTTVTGKCFGLPVPDANGTVSSFCGCIADCGPPPPTVQPLPGGTICCQCTGPVDKCFAVHWVEVTPTCPQGCKAMVNGSCDSSTGMCAPAPR